VCKLKGRDVVHVCKSDSGVSKQNEWVTFKRLGAQKRNSVFCALIEFTEWLQKNISDLNSSIFIAM